MLRLGLIGSFGTLCVACVAPAVAEEDTAEESSSSTTGAENSDVSTLGSEASELAEASGSSSSGASESSETAASNEGSSTTSDPTDSGIDGSAACRVAAGSRHTLLLHESGTLWGFGENLRGELALGTTSLTPWPMPARLHDNSFAMDLRLMIGGTMKTTAVDATGQAFVAAGVPSAYVTRLEPLALGPVQSIAPNAAVLATGEVVTWADGESPVTVAGLPVMTQVSSRFGSHTLALSETGTVYAWGTNNYGQLGIDSNDASDEPVLVEGLTEVIQVAAGATFSLALTQDGDVYAWGRDLAGELGNGAPDSNVLVPERIVALTNIDKIDAGWATGLALDASGVVWTWGDNTSGQLGASVFAYESDVPVDLTGVAANEPLIDAALGVNLGVAVGESGDAYVWGDHGYDFAVTANINTSRVDWNCYALSAP